MYYTQNHKITIFFSYIKIKGIILEGSTVN